MTQSSYPTTIDEDTHDLVLTLLLKNSMNNYTILDSRRIKSIVEDTKRILNGELWMTFGSFGSIVLLEESSINRLSPTTTREKE